MKLSTALLLSLVASAPVFTNAEEVNPVYYPKEGLVVLPKLKVNNQVFYVELRQLPGTLTFQVDAGSLQNRTMTNGDGSPSSPSLVAFDGPNTLSSDTFFNYYQLNAVAGQKLIVHTSLNQPLSTQQKTRCASSPGTGTAASSYDTQIHVYDTELERVGGICGEDLTFHFSETGTYLLHFDYASQSAGYFNAAIR